VSTWCGLCHRSARGFAILAAVPRSRPLIAVLIVLGLLATVVPAAALANGGSAGDNQYVDPLAGVHSHSGKSSSSSPATSVATTSTPATSTSAASTATTPTATSAATSTAATSTDPSSKTKSLPFTGFQDWQAAGLGLVLVASGLILRRRAHP
jgi:cytoskeletal protein RodZ